MDAEGVAIDRAQLRAAIFGSGCEAAANKAKLEGIVWPLIRSAIEDRIAEAQARGEVVVVEAALLLEAGWTDLCDEVEGACPQTNPVPPHGIPPHPQVWAVAVDEHVALERLLGEHWLLSSLFRQPPAFLPELHAPGQAKLT